MVFDWFIAQYNPLKKRRALSDNKETSLWIIFDEGGMNGDPSETWNGNMETLALECVVIERMHYNTIYCNVDWLIPLPISI